MLSNTSADQESIRRVASAYMEALQRAESLHLDVWLSLGITLSQLRTLRQLEGGALVAGDLAERVGLHPASMTRTLDRLEDGGWITRTPCDEDRRRVWVALTESAGQRLGLRQGGLRRVLEQAGASMSPEQRRAMIDGLAAFTAALPEELLTHPDTTRTVDLHS